MDVRGARSPAWEALHRTRLREDRAQAESLGSREPGELSREGAALSALRPRSEAAGVRFCWSLVPAIPVRQPSAEPGCRRVGWAPPHLGELDLQVADGTRQGRRLLLWLSILHGPVAGGHGASALLGPRRLSLWRRLCPRPCTASSPGDSSEPLYGAPHASRPRGRLIGCRTGRREGQREGRVLARLTPPRPPPLREPRHSAELSPTPEAALGGAPRSAAGPRKSQGAGPGPGQVAGAWGPQRPADSLKSGENARGTCRPLPAAARRARPTWVGSPRSGNAHSPVWAPARRPGSRRPVGRPRVFAHVPRPRVSLLCPRSQDRRPPRPTRPELGQPAGAPWTREAGKGKLWPLLAGPLTFTGVQRLPAWGPGMQLV